MPNHPMSPRQAGLRWGGNMYTSRPSVKSWHELEPSRIPARRFRENVGSIRILEAYIAEQSVGEGVTIPVTSIGNRLIRNLLPRIVKSDLLNELGRVSANTASAAVRRDKGVRGRIGSALKLAQCDGLDVTNKAAPFIAERVPERGMCIGGIASRAPLMIAHLALT
jgi:hypothetical protein